jgi:hypothetical protein
MELRKVSNDDRNVIKKRHTSLNSNVSYYVEEFDCGADVAYVSYASWFNSVKPNIGISKMENRISSRYLVNSLSGHINGS